MRPALEVADIFRRHGEVFRAAQGNRLTRSQRRVMAAIEACRTAALGGHAERCDDCATGTARSARAWRAPSGLRIVRLTFCLSPIPRRLHRAGPCRRHRAPEQGDRL